MSSPYEDDVIRLIAMRKEQLKELEEHLPKRKGLFTKKRLERKIKQYKEDIAYLEADIARYGRAMDWLRRKGEFSPRAVAEHSTQPAEQPATEQKQ